MKTVNDNFTIFLLFHLGGLIVLEFKNYLYSNKISLS